MLIRRFPGFVGFVITCRKNFRFATATTVPKMGGTNFRNEGTFFNRLLGLSFAIAVGLATNSTAIAFCNEVAKHESEKDTPWDEIAQLRPTDENFERIDAKLLHDEHFRKWVKGSVVHDTLKGENKIEAYEIYMNQESKEIVCIIRFGSVLNGYPGIVHGGITALMFDNSFGWLLAATNSPPSVTAKLTVNYR
jgi:hypothetical protein